MSLFDQWLGTCVREVGPSNPPALYLTFDDGPNPVTTPRVLELLRELGARATFFVITERAEQQLSLMERIVREGHAIGDHSLDHSYGAFFQGVERMKRWVRESEARLEKVSGQPLVGFRPPAGVRTPELHRALVDQRIPLVLWRTRFFDSLWPLPPERMLRTLKDARDGDIVLLHDAQRLTNLELFLKSLRVYIQRAQSNGFTFQPLTRELCAAAAEIPGENPR